jgi:hypothetical protein
MCVSAHFKRQRTKLIPKSVNVTFQASAPADEPCYKQHDACDGCPSHLSLLLSFHVFAYQLAVNVIASEFFFPFLPRFAQPLSDREDTLELGLHVQDYNKFQKTEI